MRQSPNYLSWLHNRRARAWQNFYALLFTAILFAPTGVLAVINRDPVCAVGFLLIAGWACFNARLRKFETTELDNEIDRIERELQARRA